jgi:hypothetical protein
MALLRADLSRQETGFSKSQNSIVFGGPAPLNARPFVGVFVLSELSGGFQEINR